ncbi:hypothetical protein QF026_001664 [Streptomyces aurantiacus]|nr:hypothetical protein [Streptomyces aurantiacus]
MGPTVAALWSCATRRGWGRRTAVSCPAGEPRGAMLSAYELKWLWQDLLVGAGAGRRDGLP